jgi:hypothetical protein
MKTLLSTILIATSISPYLAAQTTDGDQALSVTLTVPVIETQRAPAPQSKGQELMQALQQLDLKNIPQTQDGTDEMRQILNRLRIQTPVSNEGIGQITLPRNPAPMVYSIGTLIRKARKEAVNPAMGQKILHYDAAVKSVMRSSISKDGERTARMTLNRAFDVVNLILDKTNAPERHALYLANFYESAFELAESQVNSDISIFKRVSQESVEAMNYRNLYIGDFGVRFALFMEQFMNSMDPTNTHRAVITIATLGYLAWDLNLDARAIDNRTEAMSSLLLDIYNLQHEDYEMQSIKAALANNREPNLAAVRRVAWKVSQIIKDAPAVLQAATREEQTQR